MNNQKLAHNIRQVRRSRRKTQSEIADYLGIGRTAFVKIEKGDRDVKAHELEQIASYLETSVESLLGEKISKPLYFDYNAIPFTC